MFGDFTRYVVLAILFIIASCPETSKMVNRLLTTVGLKGLVYSSGEKLSMTGMVISSVVFVLLYVVYQRFVAPIFRDIEGFIEGEDREPELEEPELEEPDLGEPELGEPNLGEPDLGEPEIGEEFDKCMSMCEKKYGGK